METDDLTKTDSAVLQIRRTIRAPLDRVFAAWTEPNELRQWWGPKGVRCLSVEIDLRIGGQYRIANELPDGSVLWIVGEYETIEKPTLLVFTWATACEIDGQVADQLTATERVTVRFKQIDQGTETVLVHERIPSVALRDQHKLGWFGCMDGLADYMRSSIA